MRRVPLCIVIAITAVGWVQAGSAASPGIVVDKGVAGLSLAMTQAQARGGRGAPPRKKVQKKQGYKKKQVLGDGEKKL